MTAARHALEDEPVVGAGGAALPAAAGAGASHRKLVEVSVLAGVAVLEVGWIALLLFLVVRVF